MRPFRRRLGQQQFAARPGFDLFRAGKTVTIHLPASQVLNPDAGRRFATFRDRVLAQFPEGVDRHD
jgi:hypothetical protein